jgi:hypothetical protein
MDAEVTESSAPWSLSSSVNALILSYCPESQNIDAEKNVAQEAFKQAIAVFSSETSGDEQKASLAKHATTFQDVLDAVADVKTQYEASRSSAKATKWLQKLAHRLKFYGNVLDVLAQFHPEYVALAWGTMKFIIMVCVTLPQRLETKILIANFPFGRGQP